MAMARSKKLIRVAIRYNARGKYAGKLRVMKMRTSAFINFITEFNNNPEIKSVSIKKVI